MYYVLVDVGGVKFEPFWDDYRGWYLYYFSGKHNQISSYDLPLLLDLAAKMGDYTVTIRGFVWKGSIAHENV